MKIHILYPFRESSWGGGNQFLKALRNEFIKIGVYEEHPENADVILFNSHHYLRKVIKLKLKYPNKIFVHRIDGPVYYIRGFDLEIDKRIYYINNKIADITIFQSKFSRAKNIELGYKVNKYEEIIYNAPDNKIFNKIGRADFNYQKIKIIASSWSANWNKGFEVYKYLDENLDFNRYEFIFAGHSPISFKNIKYIGVVDSETLADYLRNSDIYIIASKNDPCSNALIEAISCGLPCVVYNDGGHPELVRKGGLLFDKKEEIINLLEEIVKNCKIYKENLPDYNISQATAEYIEIMSKVYELHQEGKYIPKKISLFSYLNFYKMLSLQEASKKFRNFRR